MEKPEEMRLSAALTLAALVLDFESETAAPGARRWVNECRQAARVIRAAIDTPPPEWVAHKVPAGHSNFNLIWSYSDRDRSYEITDHRRGRGRPKKSS